MPVAEVVVRGRVGLHARPASLLVAEAMKYACNVMLECSGRKADAKSMFGVMSLDVRCGQTITVTTEGPGAEQALQNLLLLVNALSEES